MKFLFFVDLPETICLVTWLGKLAITSVSLSIKTEKIVIYKYKYIDNM